MPSQLSQEEMIAQIKGLCQEDVRLKAALMYGSFAKGEGDAYSDIEFYLFFADEVFQTIQIDAWVAQVSPVALLLTNEFGTSVAIFENGVRGEFHFEPASRMAQIRDWPAVPNVSSPHATLVLDRTGELAGHLTYWHDKPFEGLEPDSLQTVYDRLLNWLLLGLNVLERGERVRAFDTLHHIHRHMLWLARAAEGAAQHWPTPSRGLEQDLPTHMRFAACTGGLERLEAVYAACWLWTKELVAWLRLEPREGVVRGLEARFTALSPR